MVRGGGRVVANKWDTVGRTGDKNNKLGRREKGQCGKVQGGSVLRQKIEQTDSKWFDSKWAQI